MYRYYWTFVWLRILDTGLPPLSVYWLKQLVSGPSLSPSQYPEPGAGRRRSVFISNYVEASLENCWLVNFLCWVVCQDPAHWCRVTATILGAETEQLSVIIHSSKKRLEAMQMTLSKFICPAKVFVKCPHTQTHNVINCMLTLSTQYYTRKEVVRLATNFSMQYECTILYNICIIFLQHYE